jgi:hypothetical protein
LIWGSTHIAAVHPSDALLEEKQYRIASGSIDRLEAYVASCNVCTFKGQAVREIAELKSNEVARRETDIYERAKGNVDGLHAYLRECSLCAFRADAENEIARLERENNARIDQREYLSAQGDIDQLKAYIDDCRVCAFRSDAMNAIRILQAERDKNNPTITFRLENNNFNNVDVVFYSFPGRNNVAPGVGRYYVINDRDIHSYRISCQAGEKICYGAWSEVGTMSHYWGIGRDGLQNCVDCCLTCPGDGAVVELDSRYAKNTVPTIVWHLTSEYPYTIAVVFYSADATLKWPPGDQVYLINPSESRDIHLSCQEGQRICYGAWPNGNTDTYWGVGFGGRNGCTDCCYICDGTETRLISFGQ